MIRYFLAHHRFLYLEEHPDGRVFYVGHDRRVQFVGNWDNVRETFHEITKQDADALLHGVSNELHTAPVMRILSRA